MVRYPLCNEYQTKLPFMIVQLSWKTSTCLISNPKINVKTFWETKLYFYIMGKVLNPFNDALSTLPEMYRNELMSEFEAI